MFPTDDPPFTGFNVDGYSPPPRRPGKPASPPTPRPKLAVRVLPRGAREAALALVEYSLQNPDRHLPTRAADFLKMLAANDLRVLHVDGVDADDPAPGSHLGFTALAEAPGRTPEELETLIVEQVRDLIGGEFETA